MKQRRTRVDEVFSGALGIPPGPQRDKFLAAQCGDDSALRDSVASLLRANDDVGDFLCSKAGNDAAKRDARVPRSAAGMINPTMWAEAFLQGAPTDDKTQIAAYVEALPHEARVETTQRIEAALRVRQLQDQSPASHPEADTGIPRIPGFRIERKVASGGLGVVYAAHDEKLNRAVAIKVLRHRGDDYIRRRVLDEARKAAALSDPAIVTIFSVLDESDPPAIVMELIEGFPIDRFADQLSFEQKARLLREVARGLSAAHAAGLLHRDLKPGNVIVGPDMRPRILDFGLALSLEEAGRQSRGFEGTPLYASPEQVRGESLTTASDIFSLGSLMFKVLTGRAPFVGKTVPDVLEAIATTAPPFLREVAVGVPDDLQAICLSCLAWNPADRPTASEVVVELGRFLTREPVRLKPKLYSDLIGRCITEYSDRVNSWARQSIISNDERDSIEVVHRRMLADEDHWIVDARRITLVQTMLFAGTWLAVVSMVLTVWMLKEDLPAPWRWALPLFVTLVLLGVGRMSFRQRENLASATFLAGAALAIAPCTLAILGETGVLGKPAQGVSQLFGDTFTNQQVFAASLTALIVSVFALWRLKLTGFAWTTAALGVGSYLTTLMLFDWLGQKPEIQALWCLPLCAMESIALAFERRGRVRWTLPFHLIALVALVGGLDVIALNGPTLDMLGVGESQWSYFNHDRRQALSFVLNGALFLVFMLATERARSLDLRRAARLLEVLAILHTLSALFCNAMNQRSDPHVRVDVALYLTAALIFLLAAPWRSKWRLLVGGLAGCGLGSYLMVHLALVEPKPFILGLGFAGMTVALAAYVYLRRMPRRGTKPVAIHDSAEAAG